MITIRDSLAAAHEQLVVSSDAPQIDAERLLLHVLNRTETSWLVAHDNEELTDQQSLELRGLIMRRLAGEPLAYILGSWGFYGRMFEVTPDVLIPRPDTERLIDETLAVTDAAASLLERPLILADIGTGSGCIAITLLLESSHIEHMYATDVSGEALAQARRNAKEHGVIDRITFLSGSMLGPLHGRPIDFIVSNPPYVPSVELHKPESIETRGLAFEPRLALDGGEDGMRFIRQLRAASVPVLTESIGGTLLFLK